MRRLAAFLRVPLDQHLWPDLIAAASFGAMRSRADELAPGAHAGEWRSNANFFRKARLGEWRAVLSAENLALYEALTTTRIEPRLKAWLEGGRAAAGEPRDGQVVPAGRCSAELRAEGPADLHDLAIAFAAEGDRWTVPDTGGTARRLTTHAGAEYFPPTPPTAASADNTP